MYELPGHDCSWLSSCLKFSINSLSPFIEGSLKVRTLSLDDGDDSVVYLIKTDDNVLIKLDIDDGHNLNRIGSFRPGL